MDRLVKVNVITNKTDQAMELPKMIYKNLSLKEKLSRKLNVNNIIEHIKEKQFYYHPFWISKLLIIADRKPFPPKVTPQMVFIDAITGYRGVLTNVPYVKEKEVNQNLLFHPVITGKEEVSEYILDIQTRQLNSLYMIKKPSYEMKDVVLHYLPIYKVKIESPLISKEMLINVNTSTHEDYLWSRLRKQRYFKKVGLQ